jgi:2-oxoisovalerate dehydrogenase E2 component (dihydrolipoyl transacylase)
MSASRASRQVRTIFQHATERPQWHAKHRRTRVSQHDRPRFFHVSARLAAVKPYFLADIGEGITECQIIQWFVQPGAKVAQFDKICEVQSDKAAVEITSRFDGVIKKLYYEADDMAKVGSPLVDIDIQGEISEEDEKVLTGADGEAPGERGNDAKEEPKEKIEEATQNRQELSPAGPARETQPRAKASGNHASLATPAVRHLTKELDIDILDIEGTGKDGRVLKEDVYKHAANRESGSGTRSTLVPAPAEPLGEDKIIQLSGIQKKMYQTMTHSLSIPHFLYSDNVDFTSLNRLRRDLNADAAKSEELPKLSALPFIIKAVSLSLSQFPSVNAHLDASDSSKLKFTHKASHNIGFAVDTPQGLLVPVIRNVQSHSILSLAAELTRLGSAARNNKLSASDLSDATFTVSNIGAIGGTTVAPIIVSPQVAIVGIGKTRAVPAFAEDGSIVRREESVLSWSADHRVVDGATVARCADVVRTYLENVEKMLVKLR